jgi:hypothetical protein
MKDKPHNTGTLELQLQMVEMVGEAPRKKSANERASIFLADINLLYTEILLIEDRLEGESEYVRGKHAALSMIKNRLKVAIEKL